jgi:hypothetical protein
VRITVMGVLIVIGTVMLLAVVAYALLGNGPNKAGKSDEQRNPNP